jgi:hypothetical protein
MQITQHSSLFHRRGGYHTRPLSVFARSSLYESETNLSRQLPGATLPFSPVLKAEAS